MMEYLHKLPFLFGAAAAIIVGVICNMINISQQATYLRMSMSMIIFFAIGIYVRNTLIKINDEIQEKKRIEEEKIRIELEEEKKVEEERVKQELNQNVIGSKIDIKVDDIGEDFSPLLVSEYIKSE